MRTSPQPQASQPQRSTTQQREKVATKPYMLIPEDDMRWVMGQKPAVIRLFFECWLSERYGSRWMPLNTNLKDKTLKQAKAALRKAGLFDFKSEMRILEGDRYYETLVINLHGSRQYSYWKSGGVAENRTEGNREPQVGYSEFPSGVVENPTNKPENLENQDFQNASISFQYPIQSTSSSISPDGEAGEEENRIFENKVEADQDKLEVDQGTAKTKVVSTDISLTSLLNQPEPTAQPKDSDRDKNFRSGVIPVAQVLQVNPTVRELQSNAVFIQWQVSRLMKTKFAQDLVMTPRAFVHKRIERDPQSALIEFEDFQLEMTSRIENANLRQQNKIRITPQEHEEIRAIAPYSMVTLQAAPPKLVAANELSEDEKERIRQEGIRQTPSRFNSFKRITANNCTPSKLLTPEQIQHRKDELPQQFAFTTSQNADYSESDYLDIPNPANFEAFWTRSEEGLAT